MRFFLGYSLESLGVTPKLVFTLALIGILRKTQMSYNYISVATDSELMSAFTSVMKEVNSSLAVKMAFCSQVPYWDLTNAMRSTCNDEEEIKNLVNNKLKEVRTVESLEGQKIYEQENRVSNLIADKETLFFLKSLIEKEVKAKES